MSLNDFEFARDLTASIFTAFVLALQNAGLSESKIVEIVEDATVLSETIIKNTNISVSPQGNAAQ